uniref:Uncharacterized protein n=1 Tax=Anguilla anguilla TaxID=7936 RepID=A0A0E9WBG2_ANGAN
MYSIYRIYTHCCAKIKIIKKDKTAIFTTHIPDAPCKERKAPEEQNPSILPQCP